MTGSEFQNKEVCFGKYAIKCNKNWLIHLAQGFEIDIMLF